ncbi:MAG: exodeoxyribonuclease VII small subunit [Acidimicrobiales bacterium]
MSADGVGQLSYKQASAELNAIVEDVEGADVDLDELVPKLRRAAQIVTEMDRRIKASRAQVEQIVPRLSAIAAGEDIASLGEEVADEVADGGGYAGESGNASDLASFHERKSERVSPSEGGAFDIDYEPETGMDDEPF